MPGFDIGSAATTAVSSVKKTLDSSGLAKNLTSGVDGLQNQLKSAAGQLQGAAGAVAGQVGVFANKIANLTDLGNIGLLNSLGKDIVKVADNVIPPFKNVLHNYSDYNYIFRISALDDQALNFPDETYRIGKYGQTVLMSASGDPSNRVSNAYSSKTFDFFLTKLDMMNGVAFTPETANTNINSIDMTITEPYSMGMFFEAIQTAALMHGQPNWNTAPFLLTIQFIGNVDGSPGQVLSGCTKHIPFQFNDIQMKVDKRGCVYTFKCIPYNEVGFKNTYKELKSDANISGKTVQEILQTGPKSLQAVINQRYIEMKNQGTVEIPDEIVIYFPQDLKSSSSASSGSDTAKEDSSSATADPNTSSGTGISTKLGLVQSSINGTLVQDKSKVNALGKASLGFDITRPGTTPFGKDNAVYDETTGTITRGSLVINPNESDMKFTQGSDIVNAINQVLMMSDYVRQVGNKDQIDKNGMIPWWRIETCVYNNSSQANVKKTGDKARLIVYRVVPYMVNSSKFMPPNTPAPGFDELKKQAIKEYNYIYTGKNLDVLDFDLTFRNMFYTKFAADGNANSADQKQAEQNSGAVEDDSASKPTEGNDQPSINSSPTRRLPVATKFSTDGGGGGGQEDFSTRVARMMHDSLIDGTDLAEVDLKILGDPYFIVDSGVGNYTAPETNLINLTADGGINYQNGEVDVTLNFRTPLDINEATGMYEFGPTNLVRQFSGLYQVQEIRHSFEGGKFLQTLKLTRRQNQELKDEVAAGTDLGQPTEGGEPMDPISDDEIAANNAALGDFEG